MSGTDPIPDPYTFLGFTRNPDGSVTRVSDLFPSTAAASSDPSNPVLTKDVPINHQNSTWARLYLPSSAAQKLPVIVYYHGSGFVVTSPASSIYQKFCSDIAHDTPALVVSAAYRLAPEHRLPAAYDDGAEALHWLRASDDEWLTAHADLSNCYIMGSSAGANIALHVGMREVARVKGIKGLILHQPFFGGVERTASEVRSADDRVLSPSLTDAMWSLSLPVGADRDHEFCNLVKHLKKEVVEKMKGEGWRVLVTGCRGDPLIDRQVEAVRVLEENGIDVISDFSEGGFHGMEIFDESKARIFNGILKNFIYAL